MPQARYMTSAQLQAVLRGREVRLPEGGAQSHAYYLELCRSQGLEEVTAAELDEATAWSPRRSGLAAAALPASATAAALPAALVINPPRHAQRRSSVSSRLQLAGVPFEWAPAVDGERSPCPTLRPPKPKPKPTLRLTVTLTAALAVAPIIAPNLARCAALSRAAARGRDATRPRADDARRDWLLPLAPRRLAALRPERQAASHPRGRRLPWNHMRSSV